MEMRELVRGIHTVAVVGFSADEDKPAHYVPAYLHDAGLRVIPVNPRVAEAWGEQGYGALRDVPDAVDAVLVFRRPEFCAGVAEDAAAMPHPPRVLWLQSGITSAAARAIAAAHGIAFVENHCLMVEHQRARR
jgi:predicted CoA-binding protein